MASVLGGIAVGAAWQIAIRLEVPPNTRLILVAFFLVGTDLWWCSMYGDVWFVAHSSAVAFTMLALAEVLGKRRSWIVALCGALAAGSRFNMIAALPVYAYLLARERSPAQLRREALAFGLTLVPFVIAYVAYNYARWGVPNDIGYTTWYHADPIGDLTGLPFKLKYVPYELFSFFVRPPHFVSYFPYMASSNAGIALTWTSPALILAFFARRPRPLVTAMWVAVALTAIPNFLYYAQGATQFRYASRTRLRTVPAGTDDARDAGRLPRVGCRAVHVLDRLRHLGAVVLAQLLAPLLLSALGSPNA